MTIKIDILNIEEPFLEFGLRGEHRDPKVGLREFGPLSLRFGTAHQHEVRVGLVGPRTMLERAWNWFERCQSHISSGSDNQARYPDFPGFQKAFHSALGLSKPSWRWEIYDDKLEVALKRRPEERFSAVLELYTKGLRELRGSRLDVIIACLPKEVIERCRTVRASHLTRQERELLRKQASGQQTLPGLEELVTVQDTLLSRDFRRALKARAMDLGTPIQIGTDNLFLDSEGNEDPATRAWNVSLALFYKAGGFPWRLRDLAPQTCYVGISFHHLRTRQRHHVFSSLAQAFSTAGEGFALRGDIVPWSKEQEDRHPHLDAQQAVRLVEKVLEQYRQRIGGDPLRVVLYKTTKFDSLEQDGFKTALANIPVAEMVNLRPAEFRLVRRGAYPPRRGTLAVVNESTYYLFTNGYFSDWKTYMGAHIPVPYEVNVLGDTDPVQICSEILGMTKLNWNSARAFSSTPITLRFASEVGSIMSHYADLKQNDEDPEPSYRFYM